MDEKRSRKEANDLSHDHHPAFPSRSSEVQSLGKDEHPPHPAPMMLFNYLTGPRLHIATVALYLSLALANFEVSIVSTSLVAITDSLRGFSKSNWIVTAYLITYTGFIIIWAKISDIFGRRPTLLIALIVFTGFSGACGAAQTVTQLIVFRAFQGIGGSGTFAVATVMCFELVPPSKYPKYVGMVSAVFALSHTLGPTVGGAINSEATWRWVFLLNVPAGVVAVALLLISLPPDYPYQGDHPNGLTKDQPLWSQSTFQRIDALGVIVLLAASILLVCALQEAGVRYRWSSAFVISNVVIAGLLWIAFLIWEWYVTNDKRTQEPVFPWRFVKNRAFVGMLLNTFLLGAPYTVVIVQIPQRFQAVNGLSPLGAGVRMLPLTICSPLGSLLASSLASKPKFPPLLVLLLAAALQIAGAAALSTLPVHTGISPAQYGYQVLLGLGLGSTISTLILLVPLNTERRDQTTAMGAITQFRSLGGAVALSIVGSVMNNSIRSTLSGFLSSDSLEAILQSAKAIDLIAQPLQNQIRSTYARQYNLQMKIVIGFAVAQFLATLIIWKRPSSKSH